jgi:hypothetical protein
MVRNCLVTLLDTYTFSEILELNDLTEEETLDFLIEQGYLQIPIKPVDYDDKAS